MLKRAFINNVIRLPIPHFMTYKDIKQLAEEKAGGLLTAIDLRNSGINTGKNVDL